MAVMNRQVCALVCADRKKNMGYKANGGAWQNKAAQNIKAYLEEALKDFDYVILA